MSCTNSWVWRPKAKFAASQAGLWSLLSSLWDQLLDLYLCLKPFLSLPLRGVHRPGALHFIFLLYDSLSQVGIYSLCGSTPSVPDAFSFPRSQEVNLFVEMGFGRHCCLPPTSLPNNSTVILFRHPPLPQGHIIQRRLTSSLSPRLGPNWPKPIMKTLFPCRAPQFTPLSFCVLIKVYRVFWVFCDPVSWRFFQQAWTQMGALIKASRLLSKIQRNLPQPWAKFVRPSYKLYTLTPHCWHT